MRGAAHRDEDGYEFATPFVIDGDAYSDRDREMFVLGFEFALIYERLRGLEPGETMTGTVHRENEDRIRVLCGRSGRDCTLEAIDGTWARLAIAAD
jgi:hypothetical protein